MTKRAPLLLAACALAALATQAARAADQNARQTCPRPLAGSLVSPPPDLYSSGGALTLSLDYVSNPDAGGRTLFCYITPDGNESPTLHVKPGDTLNITLNNHVPRNPDAPAMAMPPDLDISRGDISRGDISKRCADAAMNASSVNMHFHGANVAPTCHSDEVIHTLVNAGHSFTYTIQFPKDEPPGLYWYHPHVHGMSSRAVEGGASGVIVVEGIENLQPKVAGLPERLLIMRDQNVTPGLVGHGQSPSWDVSLNYVPYSYPANIPGIIEMVPGRKEFWRVANASADTIADLQLKFDGVVQTVQLVALDGVAIGSEDGTRRGKLVDANHVYIPPAGRAEFIVTSPAASVRSATLSTLQIDTGPSGDFDTFRTLATIQTGDLAAVPALPLMPQGGEPVARQRFEGLDQAPVTATRHLYFSEIQPDPHDPRDGLFYITVNGQVPQLFNPKAPPSIITRQGAVEDWVIENQAPEVHEFHIHQIHFQVRKINGVAVPVSQRQMRDTFEVPYWTGKGPYPSVTLRMDFRGAVVGDFVYHCHILDHEDLGMMAIVRVLPPVAQH